MGNWWLYSLDEEEKDKNANLGEWNGRLQKIPGGREDVFADTTIDRRSMMSLMKFLKFATDPEGQVPKVEREISAPLPNFPVFLEDQFKIGPRMQEPLFALTLSPRSPAETDTSYALSRIHRHLASIGMFGPGFGSVIPKWGGLAEIAQVACRAGAVGGGVYVLRKGLTTCKSSSQQAIGTNEDCSGSISQLLDLTLQGGESLKAQWLVGSRWDLPTLTQDELESEEAAPHVARSITIISGSLSELFPPPAEGSPPSAGAVAVFPSRLLGHDSKVPPRTITGSDPPPAYLTVHSSDTGECPTGQCKRIPHLKCSALNPYDDQCFEYLSTLSAISLTRQ